MECCNDTKESKLSKNDTLNAACTLHTDTAEWKYHCYASPTVKLKNLAFFLSNRSSEYPLSDLPRPPELAEDWRDVKYSNRVNPGEIYRGKFHSRSYLDIHYVFFVFFRALNMAPVWDVTERQLPQITVVCA